MGAPGSSRPDETQGRTREEAHWRTAGDRIQTLLDASAAGGPATRERAELLVGEVTDLYGAALQRIMRTVAMADPALAEQLTSDDLIASLLLVHGLHPHEVNRRIEDALDKVRPYLGSHGGDVTLLEVVDDAVRLQFTGSCKSCPSSAVTLELTVEDAIRAAAPEVTSIEVVSAEPTATTGVIPAESLLSRVHQHDHHRTAWHPATGVAELKQGEVGGFQVGDSVVLACRFGDEVFAYRDRCGRCHGSMAGAALHRRLGSSGAILRCPSCNAHFDVVQAGACIDENADTAVHLDPLPLLVRDGVLSIAVSSEPATVGVP